MRILIRSEMDSRLVVYPLIRALWNYGSVVVLSSTPQIKRIIVDGNNFRNVQVIVDADSNVEELLEDFEVDESRCDFLIIDNLSTEAFDVCFVLRGLKSSAEFESEVQALIEEEGSLKVREIRFGNSAKQPKEEKPKKEVSKKEDSDEYDPSKRVGELVGVQKVEKPKVFSVKFPSFEEIEKIESEHKFPQYDSGLMNAFYDVLKDTLKVDSNQFRKEVQAKDDYSGSI